VLCKFNERRTKRDKTRGTVEPRIVVPESLKEKVLKTLHDDILNGGHVGTEALLTKISEKYYWKGMHQDVLEYVRACKACALRKRAPHFKALAKSWERPAKAWQWVQCDFIGPLRKANDGSKYIMTFIDLLTGWPEAFCTKDSTAATAAKVFLHEIVCRYGRVERLHSDRGATFLSDLFREVTSRVACKQTFTTGRMPTGNARVERLHKTLEDIIGCYIPDNHDVWPDLVPVALWTVRSTISGRTGFAPYTLLFGTDPIGMGFPEYSNAPESLNDNEAFLGLRDNIAMFRHFAEDVTKQYEKEIRRRIDERANPVVLYDGDLVYMYDPLCAENRASKFSDRYRGPYRIIEVVKDNLVRLVNITNDKVHPHLVNVAKLKRAYLPWNPVLARPVLTEDLSDVIKDRPSKTDESQDADRQNHQKPPTDLADGRGTQQVTVTGDPQRTETENQDHCERDLPPPTVRRGRPPRERSPEKDGTTPRASSPVPTHLASPLHHSPSEKTTVHNREVSHAAGVSHAADESHAASRSRASSESRAERVSRALDESRAERVSRAPIESRAERVSRAPIESRAKSISRASSASRAERVSRENSNSNLGATDQTESANRRYSLRRQARKDYTETNEIEGNEEEI